jgi:YbbR domain-containing protein
VVPSDPLVTVREVRPKELSLRIERVLTATVPVKVKLQGDVPNGYKMDAAQVRPDQVSVTGPASVVEQVSHGLVAVRVEGERSSITVTRPPVPQNRNEGDVTGLTNIEPQTVDVVVPVRQVASYKTVAVVADIHGQPAPGYVIGGIEVQPAAVTIVGEPQRMEDIATISTSPVEIEGAAGAVERQVSLVKAQGVGLEMDLLVTVRVHIAPLPASTTLRLAVVPENVADGLAATVEPDMVGVVLTGLSPLLQRLDELTARVDARGLGPGTHSLTVSVSPPEGVHVQQITPTAVSLSLKPVE